MNKNRRESPLNPYIYSPYNSPISPAFTFLPHSFSKNMAFAEAAKAALLLQLSLFFLSCFTISSQIVPNGISPVMPPAHPPTHRHHHPHPPTPPPVYPSPPTVPTKPPTYAPPPKAPTKPPVYPPPPKPPLYPAPPKAPTKPPVYSPPPKTLPKPPVYPPPPKAPTKPPTYAPPKPPTYLPPKPPSYPKPSRSFVAVQGVVFCKSCKYNGSDTLLGAKPILNATVKMTCKNTKYKQVATASTDKNGYFFLQAPKTITSFGAHKCTVSLLSSPLASCSKPTDLHSGIKGAALRPEKTYTANKLSFVLYSVGPFAFEPKCY